MITIKSTSGRSAVFDGELEALIRKFCMYSLMLKTAHTLHNDGLIDNDPIIDISDILFTTQCLITDLKVWLPNDLTVFWTSVDPDENYSITDEKGSILYERK
jgi:hypothetical protein